MKKNLLFLMLMLITSMSMRSQCLGSSLYPAASVAVQSPGIVTYIDFNVPSIRYSRVTNAQSGQVLNFNTSLVGDYITVRSGTSNGPVLAYGPRGAGGLTFTNTYTGDLFVIISDGASCGSDTNTRIVAFVNIPPATHLNFDGIDDKVDLGNTLTTFFTGKTAVTIEAWVKPETNTGLAVIVGNYNYPTNTGQMQMLLRRDTTGYGFYIDGGSGNSSVIATSTVVLNTWQHVAGTWDGTTMRIYVNGVLVNSVAKSGSFPAQTASFVLGFNAINENFKGSIEDVRIWDVARTSTQISGSRSCELLGTETGLKAYFKFNQGFDGTDNTSITSLVNTVSGGANGTLVNMARTGATSNFLAGSPVTTGSIVPSNATVSTPVVYNQGATATALTATTGANGTGLLWYTTATGGTGTTTAPTPSTATVGSTSYWVSSTNANGCESERVEVVVTVNALIPATHLHFDGIDDKVDLGNTLTTFFTGKTAVTIEAWVRPETNTGLAVIVGNYASPVGNMQMLLRRDGASYTFWIDGGSFSAVTATNAVVLNTWQHVAGTWDGSTMRIYVNGALVSSAGKTGTFLAITNNFFLGYNIINENFKGSIDEVRIWDVARTSTQISGSRSCELLGTEPGLKAYFKFNQGFDGTDNTSITSLVNTVSGGANGVFSGLALTGTTSNFLAGSPVTTGSIVPSNATVSTPVVYNQGATATALTATTGANGTGLLWYTAATGGTGTTTAPTPSTATVGNTSYWVSSTNANGCESERMQIVVQVVAPATHLKFDGIDDFVAVTAPYTAFTNTISVEFWMNPNSMMKIGSGFGQATVNVDNMSSNVWLIHGNGDGTFSFQVNDNGTWRFVTSTAVTLNTWQHYTCVFDATGGKIYKNGVLNASTATGISTGIRSNATAQLHIGKDVRFVNGSNRDFDGSFDEIRIFNTALTAEQSNGRKNCELQGTETGLVAYYKFNQGGDAVNNTTITTLTNAVSGGANGTLTNMARTGTTSNFLAGSPVTTGSIVPSNATVSTPVVYNQGATATALTATTGTNGTGLLWYTAATGGTGTTTAPTPSTATAGNTSYWVSSTNANGCESTRMEIVVTVTAQSTHLNFDGVDDQVNIGNGISTALNGSSFMTVEAWIRIPNTTGTKTIVSNHNGGGSTQFNLRVAGGTINGFLGFGAYGLNSPAASITANTWHHVAMVYNDVTLKLYINGVEVASTAIPLAYSIITSTQTCLIGRSGYGGEEFSGDIDEVRIWNKALSASAITNTMNCELQSGETGLLAYYKFNQGFNAVNNAGLLSLTDSSSNTYNGTLTGFALNGTTSNWLAGSTITTGNTCATLNTSSFEVNSKIKMYPNPASSFITIEVAQLTNAKLQVLDITGKVLMNQALNNSANTVDMQQLPTGLYLFRVTSNEGTATSKIVKN